MPVYEMRCEKCNKVYEIKMKIAEYVEQKDSLECQECHEKLTQKISKPIVKLLGGGWFDQDYGITQQEMNSNLDDERRLEDSYNSEMGKQKTD